MSESPKRSAASDRMHVWALGVPWLIWGALLLCPVTKDVVGVQFRSLTSSPRSWAALLHRLGVQSPVAQGDFSKENQRLRETAKRHPEDYEMQLALVLLPGAASSTVDRLRDLQQRFPNRPSACAHVLRYQCASDIRLNRKEQDLLMGRKSPSHSSESTRPRALGLFLRTAARGERLDPDNAFFPLMRALGLFIAERDEEALAAVRVAATKPRFNAYENEEVRATWRLWDAAFGELNAIPRATISGAVLLPHYVGLRALSAVATYEAIEYERKGQREEGLSIRRALMRCGSLVRAGSPTAIGSLVGLVMVSKAGLRPGGGPFMERPDSMDSEEWERKRRSAYARYLESIGEQKEADWFRAEVRAGEQVRSIIKRGMQEAPVLQSSQTRRLVWLWIAGTGLLCGALWLTLWGTVMTISARPRPRYDPRIVAAALTVPCLLLSVTFVTRWTVALTALQRCVAQLAGTEGDFALHPVLVRVLVSVFVLCLSAGWALVLCFARSQRRRVHGAALVASVLMLLYAGVAVRTARCESIVKRSLDQMVDHEGRYFASILDETWPGPMRGEREPLPEPGTSGAVSRRK